MNKLNNDVIEFLQKLIKTCTICGIEQVAIESDVIRGVAADHEKGIFLIETDNLITLPFPAIGLGRIKTLSARLAILDKDNLTIGYSGAERDNGDFLVKKLHLSSKKTKVDYSCYDPSRIRAQRNFRDEFVYKFTISEDTLKIMSKAVAAIETSKISFSSDKEGNVRFLTSDTSGDMFDHEVSNDLEISDTAHKQNFFNSYEIKYVLPLFKASIDTSGKLDIEMSNRGVIRVYINGFAILVVPERG